MITVIGLGVEKGDLTKRGEERLLQAVKDGRPVLVRTAYTRSYETVKELGIPHEFRTSEGNHRWIWWDLHIQGGLKWLFEE